MRCAEGYSEVHGGAQRCAEVRRRAQRGARRCVEVCGGVQRGAGGVRRGAWRGAGRCTEGSQIFKCSSLFVLGYHWLPLATIDLVGDNRDFEV